MAKPREGLQTGDTESPSSSPARRIQVLFFVVCFGSISCWLAGQFNLFSSKYFFELGNIDVQAIINWDRWIQLAVNSDMADPWFDPVMLFLSSKWPWLVLISLIIIRASRLKNYRTLKCLLWIGATIGLADSLSHFVLKPWFGRLRPCLTEGLVRVVDGCAGYYSFPSNHAANAAVFATLWFCLRGPWQGFLALFCAVLIGISRIYLGVHYPSDIVGGFVFGSCLGALSYLLWYKLDNWRSGKTRRV